MTTSLTAPPGGSLPAHDVVRTLGAALGIAPDVLARVQFSSSGELPSVYAVSDLAAATVGVAAAALEEWRIRHFGPAGSIRVDRRLASLWFGASIRPLGWALPPAWDPVAGDYPAADGWVRLHTNAPHHRDAALRVLDVPAVRREVARAVSRWSAQALETAIVDHHGCAARMRSAAQWAAHPQGRSVRAEPLLAQHLSDRVVARRSAFAGTSRRPLQGIRVLDLTRVLAGPVATRFLAGFGAQVLRIDPPGWDEPAIVPDMTVGKQCARLDLRRPEGRARLLDLLRDADIVVHGYRADALERLGLGAQVRRDVCPGLIDVRLNAYGFGGPWVDRRGFDSLVQMSTGIADAGMRALGRDRPTPLPVQALDHATGYLMAAAALRGLVQRLDTGRGGEVLASLARTAQLLADLEAPPAAEPFEAAAEADWASPAEATAFGPLLRLRSPVQVGDTGLHWDSAAVALGSSPPQW